MEYGEYAILELAVEFGIPLCIVAGPRELYEAQWAKPWHGLEHSQLLDIFEKLALTGDIFIRDSNWDAINLSRSELNVEFETRRPHSERTYYGLTPQGGMRWEQFSKADWSRYHSWEWDDEGEGVLEIAALTSETAERASRYVGPFNELRIFVETLERRTLQPWMATYWKSFEVGHAVRFKCEYFDEDEIDQAWHHYFPGLTDAQMRQAYACVHQDYEYFSGWYTKHPDTPPMERV